MNEQIKARRLALKWPQALLAMRVGTTQQTVDRIESGEIRHSRFMMPILRVLGMSLDLAQEPPGVERSTEEGDSAPSPQFASETEMPIFAAAEGGDGELVVSSDPIDYVQRPWFLSRVRDPYGVVVTGDSMVPVYRPGDLLLVNPRLPPLREKNAIFVAGEERGEFRAAVKEYLGATGKEWLVRQYNPPKDFGLPKAEWAKALRIVGRYEG